VHQSCPVVVGTVVVSLLWCLRAACREGVWAGVVCTSVTKKAPSWYTHRGVSWASSGCSSLGCVCIELQLYARSSALHCYYYCCCCVAYFFYVLFLISMYNLTSLSLQRSQMSLYIIRKCFSNDHLFVLWCRIRCCFVCCRSVEL
jgi:hypothetical protein